MRSIALLTLLSAAALAAPPGMAPTAANTALDFVGSEGSVVRYKLVHKFHDEEGVTRAVKSRVRVLPDGVVQVMARAEVGTFDSGNGNRDVHMKEVVEAAKFPFVEVKAVGSGLRLPAQFPATVEVPLHGQLSFHGITRPIDTTAHVTFTDAQHVSGEATFPVSLDSYRVERPSLAFVKVDDNVQLVVHLVMTGAAR
jgi:hypothetical protein